MLRNSLRYTALFGLLALPHLAQAAALQVAPVLLEIPSPGATSSVMLRNEGLKPLQAQIRIFRWTQSGGQDQLEPVTDVVASPPTTSLNSRTDYAVRVVRLNKAPVEREEAYRLIVDELPDANREKNGTVAVVLRHSIPVFFSPADAETARIKWKASLSGGKLHIQATNSGGRRIRLSAIKVSDGKTNVNLGDGLVGYALAGNSVTISRSAPKGFGSGMLTINGQSDLGPVNAQVSLAR